MDPIVEAALKKWPNVPHCYGWLALDQRGDWYMRDDRVQRAGPFPAVKGSRIEHDKLLAFIGRNYGSDDRGARFFQNGPQRVYVELEAAPWVWRLDAAAAGQGDAAVVVVSHTGLAAGAVRSSHVDETGRLFLAADGGFGIVHTLDMATAADAVERGDWTPQPVRAADLAPRFGFRLSPAADAPPGPGVGQPP